MRAPSGPTRRQVPAAAPLQHGLYLSAPRRSWHCCSHQAAMLPLAVQVVSIGDFRIGVCHGHQVHS